MKPFCSFVAIGCLLGFVSLAPAQNPRGHVGRVSDWSTHHLVVSGGPSAANLKAAETEPRILFYLVDRNLVRAEDGTVSVSFPAPESVNVLRRAQAPGGGGIPAHPIIHRDWSVSMGNGNISLAKFPAKFSFDVNGTPSCTADFAVFPLNVAGATGGQANIVGINKLYSGTGPTGLCGNAPAVTWAYNGSTAGGSVVTSPTISLDGTKIAYVESAPSSSIFHVLTVKAGQGTVTNAAAPTANGSCTGGAAASSCLVSTTYSATATTTLADAWVDYQTDKAFVASDDGKVSRISCVFSCALNAQPTVDWTFTLPVAGTGGAQPVPSSPVYDYPSGRLFVGDQLGEIWVINAKGSTPTLNAGPVMVGGGGCTIAHPPGRTGTGADCTATGTAYGIPDAVMMDASGGSQKIFVLSGNNGSLTAGAILSQFSMSLTQRVDLALGLGGVNLYSGAFNNGYWGTTPQTSGFYFICGTGATDTTPWIYWVGFAAYPTMDSTYAGNVTRSGPAGAPCVPFTEFYNPNINLGGVAGHHDELMGGIVAAGTRGLMITDDISVLPLLQGLNDVTEQGGVGGVVVDDVSTSNQASSMYFGTLTQHTAVKLTQLNSK
ncbi:MAG TPA: hypothetical protein VMI10_11025 [Terriglobales bacterium]|nr:hypothetical protein [Terriglobales bacterium]